MSKRRTSDLILYEPISSERMDLFVSEIRHQQLNEVLGKPVDLARVWECWEELRQGYRDACEIVSDEYQALQEQFEEMSADCKREEERADEAEKEVLTLQDEIEKLESEIEELRRAKP